MSLGQTKTRAIKFVLKVLLLGLLATTSACNLFGGGSDAVDPTASIGGAGAFWPWGYLDGTVPGAFSDSNTFVGGIMVELDGSTASNEVKITATMIVPYENSLVAAKSISKTTTAAWGIATLKIESNEEGVACGGRLRSETVISDTVHEYVVAARCNGGNSDTVSITLTAGAVATNTLNPTLTKQVVASGVKLVKKTVQMNEGGLNSPF